jgi:4a-hydroxytetrahydrobiopterin dehydratase
MTPEEISQRIATLGSGWHIQRGVRLCNVYVFPNYMEGVRFVERVASVAEKLNHHPDIVLRWGQVAIETYTHTTGALTDLDVALAEAVQDCFVSTMAKKPQG